MSNIVYINTAELYPHPDNPRKELGDLTELAASIRSKGIMQNLTVVPRDEGGYTVIIGHRRCGAAKLAGLTALPCVITEMSPQDQVATMLLENMQRNDLTLYEQAAGMQMMIDFGESVEDVAEKTGFSKQTVKRRLKLAELDADKLKEASMRQISIEDLDKLARIESVDDRNRLLNVIGTQNFAYSVKDCLQRQDENRMQEEWRKVLLDKGLTEIPYKDAFDTKYKQSKTPYATISHVAAKEFVLQDDMQFFVFNRGSVYFRRERNAEDDRQNEEWNRRAEETRQRIEALKTRVQIAYETRCDFATKLVTDNVAKKAMCTIIEIIIRTETEKHRLNYMDYYDTSKLPNKKYSTQIQEQPYRMLFLHAYIALSDREDIKCYTYDGSYNENKRLALIYELLTAVGYKMSDEENMLLNGTHPLYKEVTE